MLLIERVRQIFEKRQQDAKTRYLAAMKAGKPADVIAELAAEANIPLAQVESDCEVVDRATALIARAQKLPELCKATAAARQAAEEASRVYEEAIKKLEPAVNESAFALEQAHKEEVNARRDTENLAGLYSQYPDLLNPVSAPTAVRDIWTRDNANQEATRRVMDRAAEVKALQAAVETAEVRVSAAADLVRNAERPHPDVRPETLQKNTEPFRKQLAAAEQELEQARVRLAACANA